MSAPLCDCVTYGPCPWHHEDMETDTTIPSILEYQLRKSVELTKRPIEQPDDEEQRQAIQRLKKLLADTKQMVVRAEALVDALRAPHDYYDSHGR